MSVSKTTPMIQQYLAKKEEYADALLFFRMGDFYEMFFEDAELASRLLEITLTSRNKKDKKPIPMCGVPVKAVQGYIARLIAQGYKVAICDQIEDPAKAKGLVKRDITRVITPGMVIENELLDAKQNNYVLALARRETAVGIAFLDISTGTFRLAESADLGTVTEEILRIAPREILLSKSRTTDPFLQSIDDLMPTASITELSDDLFELRAARKRLIAQFQTQSLEGFGCEHLKAGVSAAGALMEYVQDTQKQPVTHLSRIETYSLEHFLGIDDRSCQNLELFKNLRSGGSHATLIGILDNAMTAMGSRLMRHWLRYPLKDFQAIQARLDAVEEAKNQPQIRIDIKTQLKSVYDLERIGSKIAMGHGNGRDLLALKRSLQSLPALLQNLAGLEAGLYHWKSDLSNLYELAEHIERAIRDDCPPTINEGGLIKSEYNNDLDELIQISQDGKGWLLKLEASEKSATNINSLKVRYNKVFGYYIEIPKTHAEAVPAHYIRKQTLVNAERYITDELKTFEAKVLGAEERRAALEYSLFLDIRQQVVECNVQIQAVAEFLAQIDCLIALADVAALNNYSRPEINTQGSIVIQEGRHPVVEKMITGERFVPNSIQLDNEENQILIITGPNMAGKSTVLRQVALLVIMCQMGSFIPATKASIAITDRIFTRVGALDNLSQGQSTFMVEMEETANILNNASDQSLVIMDEIGRGTSTFDGISIAWAVAEFLHDAGNHGIKTLFATHYHELTELSASKARVKNFNIAVKEWNDEIIFLRKLIPGGTNRSYGIQVARLAGIPEAVVARSKKILSRIEDGNHQLSQISLAAGDEDADIQKPRQLDLFQNREQVLIAKLRKLDISTMTPIDAMNYLHTLHEKIKDI